MRLLAIDLGYSSVKVAYYNEAGDLQFDKYMSAVAKIENPIEDDNDIMFRLGVDCYLIGTSALKVSRSLLMPLETFEDMKAVYPVWISYLLKKYGAVDRCIVGLSMAFSDRAEELLKYLQETLLIQDENFFMCLPQGLAAKLTYSECGLDIRETLRQHNDSKMQNFLIVDGGFNTIDAASVSGGKSSSGAAMGIPNSGLICVAYNIVDYLFKEFQMKISIKEAQNIIDNGGIFSRRGRKYDISGPLERFIKVYLTNVLNLIEDKYGEYLDAVQGIIILGGLAYFFQKYIEDPDIVKEIEKHFPVSFLNLPVVDAEYYNCYAYLKFAEKRLLLGSK